MVKDERVLHSEIKREGLREGKEEGISIGIKYWEINMAVSEIINNASAQESIEEKMRILSTQGEYVQHLYEIFKSNPESQELYRQQEGLENRAESCGLVITEKGIYLNNIKK